MKRYSKYVSQPLTTELRTQLINEGVRIMEPGFAYTMEVDFTRINVKVDENNVITSVYTG